MSTAFAPGRLMTDDRVESDPRAASVEPSGDVERSATFPSVTEIVLVRADKVNVVPVSVCVPECRNAGRPGISSPRGRAGAVLSRPAVQAAAPGTGGPAGVPPAPKATPRASGRRRRRRRAVAGAGRTFVCTECAKKFNTGSGLQKHLVSHIGRKDWECDVCHKMFAYKGSLAGHRAIHVRDSPYECRHCPKKFAERTSLAAHERSHSGFKPHECHVCGRRYVREGNLDIHLRTHVGEIFL